MDSYIRQYLFDMILLYSKITSDELHFVILKKFIDSILIDNICCYPLRVDLTMKGPLKRT